MKHITRWEPDTHPGVVVEYEWDDEQPEDEREHVFKRFVNPPSGSRFTGSDLDRFEKVITENRAKNQAVKQYTEEHPEILEKVEVNGEEVTQIKRGLEPNWSIKNDGTVEIKGR
jgi:hypothetical protein